MIAAGHRARSLRVPSWQDSPHEYRIRLEEVCECVCLQVMGVFFMCLRLYGPIWVRSMSDEGHREQMACWRCMNTLTHLSLSLCIIQPGLFSLSTVPHNPKSYSKHTRTCTHTEFNIYVLSLTCTLICTCVCNAFLVTNVPYCVSAGV